MQRKESWQCKISHGDDPRWAPNTPLFKQGWEALSEVPGNEETPTALTRFPLPWTAYMAACWPFVSPGTPLLLQYMWSTLFSGYSQGVQGNEWTQYQFQPYKRPFSSPVFVSKPSSTRHSLTGSKAHSFCISSSSGPFKSRELDTRENCQAPVSLAPTEPLVSCIFQLRLFSLVLMWESLLTGVWARRTPSLPGVHHQYIAEGIWGESRAVGPVGGLSIKAKRDVLSKYSCRINRRQNNFYSESQLWHLCYTNSFTITQDWL